MKKKKAQGKLKSKIPEMLVKVSVESFPESPTCACECLSQSGSMSVFTYCQSQTAQQHRK